MIAYEIHTMRDNKWRIIAIYDDLETARHEAKITAELGFDQGVLVIEENYDPFANKATWRTRFRAGKFARRVWGELASTRRGAAAPSTASASAIVSAKACPSTNGRSGPSRSVPTHGCSR